MIVRDVLGFAALSMVSLLGCAGPGSSNRGALMAYSHPPGDPPPAARGRIEVEPISEGILRDPARMVELRLWIERQIGVQTADIPQERYQRDVRPRLARALRSSGLLPVDVDQILRGVDYHRSL
jgi:hypothetical protein